MHQSSGGAVEAHGVFLNTADSFPAKLDSGRALRHQGTSSGVCGSLTEPVNEGTQCLGEIHF